MVLLKLLSYGSQKMHNLCIKWQLSKARMLKTKEQRAKVMITGKVRKIMTYNERKRVEQIDWFLYFGAMLEDKGVRERSTKSRDNREDQ